MKPENQIIRICDLTSYTVESQKDALVQRLINSNFLPSQNAALEESLTPIFVASEQGLDTSI